MLAERLPPTRDNICAVVVTFHPDEGFEKRLALIAAQVGRVIIVDNASTESAVRRLNACAEPGRIDVIALPENLGVGTALNRGLQRALDDGFAWGLTFDQDSEPQPHLVAGLVAVYAEHPDRSEIGVIGANYEEETTGTTGTPKNVLTGGPSWMDVDSVITSGCLQSLRAFREVGGYREDFFIYFVDTEFCWRVALAGYRVILTRATFFRHRTGSITKHRIFHREYLTPHYAPWRHYYLVRNGLLIAREEWSTDRWWAIRWTRALTRRSVLTLLFEPAKAEKLRFMLKGAGDAIVGRTGKLPEAK